MADPTVPPVTDAAIEAAMVVVHDVLDADVYVTKAEIARRILEVAAPHMVPPPALPTEPGSVVLVAMLDGVREDPPAIATRLYSDLGIWQVYRAGGVPEQYAAEDITEWIPAQVVPADDSGPIAALRQIADLLDDSETEDDEAVERAHALAVAALKRLGGDQ